MNSRKGRMKLARGQAYLEYALLMALGAVAMVWTVNQAVDLVGRESDQLGCDIAYGGRVDCAEILGESEAPTAIIVYSCTGNVCSFDGTGSFDPDGEIIELNWYIDNEDKTGWMTDHVFQTEGQYPVTLQVMDDDGNIGMATEVVLIGDVVPSEPDPECPASDPNGDLKGARIYFDAQSGLWVGTVRNESEECSYRVGFAAYSKPGGGTLDEQVLYSSDPAVGAVRPQTASHSSFNGSDTNVVEPGETAYFYLEIDDCGTQLDIFFDADHLAAYSGYDKDNLAMVPLVLDRFNEPAYGPNGSRYGPRLLRALHTKDFPCGVPQQCEPHNISIINLPENNVLDGGSYDVQVVFHEGSDTPGIRSTFNGTDPKSVRFQLFDAAGYEVLNRVETGAPFRMMRSGEWETIELLSSAYTLTATTYTYDLECVSETVQFTNDNYDDSMTRCPGSPTIGALMLINADTDETIGAISNGDFYDLASMGVQNVAVEAVESGGKPGSVVFEVNGTVIHTESQAPYAIAGDNQSGKDFNAWSNIPYGEVTLRATVFTKKSGGGEQRGCMEVTFTIVDGTS